MKFQRRMRIMSLLVAVSALVSMMVTGVSAVDLNKINEAETETQVYNFDEYVESLNLDMTNVVDITMGTVQLESENSGAVAYASENASRTELDVPAVIATKQNDDGTITSSAYIELAVDASGNLVSGIQLEATNGGADAEIQKVITSGGFSATMEATYYRVSMLDYGSNGYAYAPSYSYYTITRGSATGTMTNCTFYTLLHGTYSVKNTDPTVRVQAFPQYMHTYSAGTPVLSYKYSFNDYSLYSNSSYDYGGYSGQLIHIPLGGNGSYSLKTEFTYGGKDYTLRYGIYNVGDLP